MTENEKPSEMRASGASGPIPKPFWNPRYAVARAIESGNFNGPVSSITPSAHMPPQKDGVIVIKLRELMLSRGLVSGPKAPRPYRGQPSVALLMRMTGLSRDKCWQILNHPSTMRHFSFSTIAAICKAFKCQPGDFLEWRASYTSFDRITGMVKEDTLSTKYGMGLTDRPETDREDAEREAKLRRKQPSYFIDTD
jgi:DNA-binding Xre family transcriptional regulator